MGFMEVYCKGEDIHPYLKTLGEEPLEIVRTGIGVKKYPSCYCTHRAVQGILDMMAERPIQPSKVERILVSVEPGGLRPLIHKRPWLGLEGKFSMQYTLAAALLDGGVGLGSFTDAAVQRPEAQALLQKVEADEENTDPLPRRALVEVELRDEKPRTIRVENLRGGELLPLTDGELEEKLRDCARFSQLEMDVEGFLSAVWDWRDRPIRNILQQFRSA
jgi:2-methylcitrate dehydratase PrpD